MIDRKLWASMTPEQRSEYVKKNKVGICPYCGEETRDLDQFGQLFAMHILNDWQTGKTKKFQLIKKEDEKNGKNH